MKMISIGGLLKKPGATAGLSSSARFSVENTAGQASSGTHFFAWLSFQQVVQSLPCCSLAVGILVGCLACQCRTADAEPPFASTVAERVDFQGQIRPIFAAHCLDCHGPELQEADLRLDRRRAALRGGISGDLFSKGQSRQSLLYRRLTTTDAEERMPLDAEPLSADEIELIRRWIDQGADWAETETIDESDERHWAYVKPVRPNVPKIDDEHASWARTPVDAFILARLSKEGLAPALAADRARLLRRLYLDLVGLPPTIAEVDSFTGDSSPTAWETVVDRLLASPRFGEHWARPWLDQARYADSNGYQADQYRNVWPYRDWVIQALNDDMPFDRFTVEQLAGDLLPSATHEQKIATGFHRLTTCNVEAGVDPEENRVNQIIDRVNTTATVWLGTTLTCAQCHNHKYDPFTQRDYYQLFAYFNNTPIEVEGDGTTFNFIGPKMELPLPDKKRDRRRQLTARRDRLEQKVQETIAAAKATQADWEAHAVADGGHELPEKIASSLAISVSQRDEKQSRQVTDFFLDQHADVKHARQRLTAVKRKLTKLDPVTTLVMVEGEQPRATAVLRRGNFLNRAEQVAPATPSALHAAGDDLPGNRLGLARWLVDQDNPLTARVAVNRWWAELFGRGLVATVEDFGTQGARPTHPQLLDWLACEFVDCGWSMKHVLKTIVMSATYRQSSHVSPDMLARDPGNELYARGPRLRLSAETIRDNALAISGLLTNRLGGPPVYPPQPAGVWRHVGRNAPRYTTSTGEDRFRRGIYVVWRRSAPYASFTNFDAPDRASCTVARPTTNTPLQALTLLNDPAYVEMARALAARMAGDDAGMTVEGRIAYGFRLCLARAPTAAEVDELKEFYLHEQARFEQSPAAAQELIDDARENDVAVHELAAWFFVANVLLNLDETITKG